MYKKIKNFAENCWENSSLFRLFLIMFILWFIVGCIITTKQNKWETMFTYPESDYQVVQKEAERMIKTHDFETNLELNITSYSNTTHSLSFELRGKENSCLTVTVSNYMQENEEVSYKRFSKSPTSFILMELLAILLVIVLFALLSGLVILICISIVWFVAFVIHKILEHSKNKKDTSDNVK